MKLLRTALLLALTAGHAMAQDDGGRPAECLLFVNGTEHIRGKCIFTPLDGDGSFKLMALNGAAFAYVLISSKGVAQGHWNEGNYANHAHTSLGQLLRNDACWVNDTASVCAW